MDLTINFYDVEEEEARIEAPYPILRAFTPTHFRLNGFPDRVIDERELRRYADIMGETTSRSHWLKSKLYTRAEAAAALALSGQVIDLTRRLYGRPVTPFMCLFGPIPMLRMVEHLSAIAGRKLTVMDVSAGSGYTSAYLLNAGHKVIATDVTQALYLWQNRLFRDHYDLDEWAVAVRQYGRIPAQCTHVPWWHFARLHEGFEGFKLPVIDVVICDAALAEMDPWAFRYVMQLAYDKLKDSDIGCLLYQSVGEQRAQKEPDIEAYIRSMGFLPNNKKGVAIWSANKKLYAIGDPPPIGGKANLHIGDFMQTPLKGLMESYEWCEYIGVGK